MGLRGCVVTDRTNLIWVIPAQGALSASSAVSSPSEEQALSDVVVVGGGVIGLGVAWRARLAGLSVTLVDPAPGAGASWAAAGMLAPVTEVHYGEEALLALNLASAARYPSFVAELEDATGLDGGLPPVRNAGRGGRRRRPGGARRPPRFPVPSRPGVGASAGGGSAAARAVPGAERAGRAARRR